MPDEVLGEQRRPRLLEDGATDAVVNHQQLLEEELIRQSSDAWTAEPVDLVALSDQRQRAFKCVFDVREDCLCGSDSALGGVKFLRYAVVFLSGQIARDASINDATAEALALKFKVTKSLLGTSDLRSSVLALSFEFGPESLSNGGLSFLGQSYGGVVVLDRRFDDIGCDVRLIALRSALVTPHAEEVEVAALGVGQTQARTALAAEDTALEVVVMNPLLLPRSVALLEKLLNGFEERLCHQRLVTAFVFGAEEGDVAEVVTILQQVRDVRTLYGTWDLAAVRQRAQALRLQRFRQRGDGVFAAAVSLEGPLHEFGTVGVDGNGANFAAVDHHADIAVANRGAAGCAADLGFAGHALDGFGTDVAALELRDRRQDAVKEAAGWRLVDVLLAGDQLGPGHAQFEEDVGVVATVAGEAVDLVQDDVVDVALSSDAFEHALELNAIGSLGALAALDVFVDDLGSKFRGAAVASFALCRERVTLVLVNVLVSVQRLPCATGCPLERFVNASHEFDLLVYVRLVGDVLPQRTSRPLSC